LTNHLDRTARHYLYKAIQTFQGGIIIASHDRELLNLMDEIIEVTSLGVFKYGGNYAAYQTHKNITRHAKEAQLADAKKALSKIKKSIQNSIEKHEKRQRHGRALRRANDQPKILLDAMKNKSDQTKGAHRIRHQRMLKNAEDKIYSAKLEVEINDEIHIALSTTKVPPGKMMVDIEELYFSYGNKEIIQDFSLKIQGSERIALIGNNGSGKTTLVKLILKELKPDRGIITIGTERVSYLDQHVNLLKKDLTILENYLHLNPDANENDGYHSLANFLFKNISAQKYVRNLSNGEKLRALLACTLLSRTPPQLLILDEPTNHLDLDSIKSIESALKNYQGTLIVISHDHEFLKSIQIEKTLHAPSFLNNKR